jgi:hypothetical protein
VVLSDEYQRCERTVGGTDVVRVGDTKKPAQENIPMVYLSRVLNEH